MRKLELTNYNETYVLKTIEDKNVNREIFYLTQMDGRKLMKLMGDKFTERMIENNL